MNEKLDNGDQTLAPCRPGPKIECQCFTTSVETRVDFVQSFLVRPARGLCVAARVIRNFATCLVAFRDTRALLLNGLNRHHLTVKTTAIRRSCYLRVSNPSMHFVEILIVFGDSLHFI